MRRFTSNLSRAIKIKSGQGSNADWSQTRQLTASRPIAGTTKLPNWSAKEALLTSQQVRKYTSDAAQAAAACWNCNAVSARREHMICDKCGHLQDVDAKINYFELLNIPKNFALEPHALTKRFRQLQTLVHPDKYSNKSAREQINSADWSSLINKAYKTLSIPIERGQYMLKLHGQQIPKDNSALDKEFLLEMMERNEEVEEAATSEDLQRLNAQIVEELNEKSAQLEAQFQQKDLEQAKAVLVQMKYLISMQASIKNKLQSMMGAS